MPTLSRPHIALLAGATALAGLALPAIPASATTPEVPAAPVLRYQVGEVIQVGQGGLTAMAMNEHTDIAGASSYPNKAVIRTAEGDLEVLPGLPDRLNNIAHDVNDTGMAAGISGSFGGEDEWPHAVRWVDGEVQDLGAFEPSGQSEAYGINDAGTVVGAASKGFGWGAFVWTEEDGMVDIAGSSFAWAYDINESGQVTGHHGATAYVWQDGVLRDLEKAAGFAHSFAQAINDVGQVAGSVSTADGNSERFARWTPDGEVEVLGGAGEHNIMWGINNDGTTVGRGVVSAGIERGVIYHDDIGLEYIDDLMTTSEWGISFARDINDAGQILASGFNRYTGDGATLRLDPVSGPFMQEQGLKVKRVDGAQPKAVGTLKVVDKAGNPVRGARVEVGWFDGDRAVDPADVEKTDRRGAVKFTRSARGMGGITMCINEITHPRYDYVPAGGGLAPCATA